MIAEKQALIDRHAKKTFHKYERSSSRSSASSERAEREGQKLKKEIKKSKQPIKTYIAAEDAVTKAGRDKLNASGLNAHIYNTGIGIELTRKRMMEDMYGEPGHNKTTSKRFLANRGTKQASRAV